MSDAPTPTVPLAFRAWFRQELFRALRCGAVLLVAGLAAVYAADKVWSGFAAPWARLNFQLTTTALEQHPTALLDAFATRLSGSEYGWGFHSWRAPFNATAARARLQAEFPEFLGLDPDGRVLGSQRRPHAPAAAAAHDARAAAYRAAHQAIGSRRFNGLYPQESPFNVTGPTTRLARLVTKFLGLPDALLHLGRTIVRSGFAGMLLFAATLAIAATALRRSHRPARRWLKILLCPLLASSLAWVVIGLMALAAALCGGFTANTSALAVFAGIPLLHLAAQLPLRLLEGLQLQPKPWDGVERRRNPRPPAAS